MEEEIKKIMIAEEANRLGIGNKDYVHNAVQVLEYLAKEGVPKGLCFKLAMLHFPLEDVKWFFDKAKGDHKILKKMLLSRARKIERQKVAAMVNVNFKIED